MRAPIVFALVHHLGDGLLCLPWQMLPQRSLSGAAPIPRYRLMPHRVNGDGASHESAPLPADPTWAPKNDSAEMMESVQSITSYQRFVRCMSVQGTFQGFSRRRRSGDGTPTESHRKRWSLFSSVQSADVLA